MSAPSKALSVRHRLSNVSVVVSRKLSSTIGWKQPVLPSQDIITQGKCQYHCQWYIHCRLKRSGVFNRKLGVGTTSLHVAREVFPALLNELERMYSGIYTEIPRQLTRFGRSVLRSPETALVDRNGL